MALSLVSLCLRACLLARGMGSLANPGPRAYPTTVCDPKVFVAPSGVKRTRVPLLELADPSPQDTPPKP